MGLALEWLTLAERDSIARGLLTRPMDAAGRIGAHCPFHAEKSPGGAFFYNPADDVAHCYSCATTTDLIGVWNAVHGRDVTDPDGVREFRAKYAPDVRSQRPADRPKSASHEPRSWNPGDGGMPPQAWREGAGRFVDHSLSRLLASPTALDDLAWRGISSETARICRLGWNDRDKYVPVTSWGLPHALNDQGREKKIWLPQGLVIPWFQGGEVVRIKIRRVDGGDPKYWQVKGGGTMLYRYGRPDWPVWVVVETERDAALLWQDLKHLRIGAVATGSAAARPDAATAAVLRGAALVLVALDSDQAGATNAWKFWEREFPNSTRWLIPRRIGKDVGDAAMPQQLRGLRGFSRRCVEPFYLDLASWALAGVPAHVRRLLPDPSRPRPAQAQTQDQAEPPRPPRSRYEQILDCIEEDLCADTRKAFESLVERLRGLPVRWVQDRQIGELPFLEADAAWERTNWSLMGELRSASLDLARVVLTYFPDRLVRR